MFAFHMRRNKMEKKDIFMSSFDYIRLVAWMKDVQRKAANEAFTAGAARDAAYAFEDYIAGQDQ